MASFIEEDYPQLQNIFYNDSASPFIDTSSQSFAQRNLSNYLPLDYSSAFLSTDAPNSLLPGGSDTRNFYLNESNLTYRPWITIVIGCIATLMSSMTIIGNVLVITAFIIDKNLRKYSNYFILNLSVADLLIGILIPPYTPFLLYQRSWRLGDAACTIWLVLDYVVGSASVLCIVVISLDRYLLVSRGLNYVAGQKVYKAILIIFTVWMIAFMNYAPAIIFWEMITGKKTGHENECQAPFHDNLVYLTATACVEFFAPLISICGLNLAVYLNIRKRSRGLIRTENPRFTLTETTIGIPSSATTLSMKSSFKNKSNKNTQTEKKCKTKSKSSILGTKRTDSTISGVELTEYAAVKKNEVVEEEVPKARPSSVSRNANSELSVHFGKMPNDKKSLSFKRMKNDSKPFSATSPGSSSTTGSSTSDEDFEKLKKSSTTTNSTHAHHARIQIAKNMINQRKQSGGGEESVNLLRSKSQGDEITKQEEKPGVNEAIVASAVDSQKPPTAPSSPKSVPFRPNNNELTKTNSAASASLSPSYSTYSRTKKSSSTTSRTLTKDKKAARSLFILVFVFVFCWAPYTFLTLMQSVCKSCVNEHAYEFTFWLLWFNSTLNPILYPFLHVKFRKAFLKIIQHLLFCFKFKPRNKYRHTTTVNSA